MRIFAVDPGPEHSGWCQIEDGEFTFGVSDNACIRACLIYQAYDLVAIEMIASYGMAVGKEVFDTCVEIGKMMQASNKNVRLIFRKDVKLHICGDHRAKDANVRQGLLDMFPRTGGGKIPQIGTKKKPGPLYGCTSHAWAALAVAITARDKK